MRHFKCVVSEHFCEYEETETPTGPTEYKAILDGQEILYTIKKHKSLSKQDKWWSERAGISIYYHGRRLGANILWIPVTGKGRKKTKRQRRLAWYPSKS